ncbi:hypothetical protein [Rhizobium wenxiniae]|nr:hypothetical protein [Rhizobium wenxiniae]
MRTAQPHVTMALARRARAAAPSVSRGSAALATKEASWEEF